MRITITLSKKEVAELEELQEMLDRAASLTLVEADLVRERLRVYGHLLLGAFYWAKEEV